MRIRNLIIMLVLFLAFSLCFLLPSFVKKSVFADGEITNKIILLDSNYAGSNASSFTPFDFTNQKRMDGKSLKPEQAGNNIVSENIELENVSGLLENENYQLGAWVYFSSKDLMALTFTLSGKTSSGATGSLTFSLSPATLEQKLTKSFETPNKDLPSDGYGWNYLEIPFSLANNYNAIENGQYINFTNLEITYNLTNINPAISYSKLYFYDISIENSNITEVTVEEENKQYFRICKFKFYSQDELNQVYVNDALNLSSRNNTVLYAWVGDTNILDNPNSYNFKVEVKKDDSVNLWEYSSSFAFNEAGQYIVKFSISKDNEELLWQAHSFNVKTFSGISFSQSISEFQVGKTVRFYLYFNTNLTNVSNLSFSIIGDCATISNIDSAGKFVDVKMLNTGNFTLVANGKGERLFDKDITLSCQREFSVVNGSQTPQNTSLIIALSVVLGITVITGIVLGIKSIVKANKYKVR